MENPCFVHRHDAKTLSDWGWNRPNFTPKWSNECVFGRLRAIAASILHRAFSGTNMYAIVNYVPRCTMRVIARRAKMLARDRCRGAINPASIVANLAISRIVCIGIYSILCDFGAYTSFFISRPLVTCISPYLGSPIFFLLSTTWKNSEILSLCMLIV